MSNCSSSNFPEFIQSEAYFSTSLHILTSLSLPIHLFSAYCILFKSPAQMSDMKWAMFNLHCWSVAFDISLGFLYIPYLQLPAIGGVGLGVLTKMGVGLGEQAYFGMCMLGTVIVSVACLFETRYYLLYAEYSIWKCIRRPWLAANYLLAFTYMLPMYLTFPDQKTGKEELMLYIPCLPDFLYEDRYFIVTVHRTWTVLNIGVLVLPVPSESFFFVILIHRNMAKMKKLARLSEKTLKLQKTFLRALILQVTLPVINIITPIFYYLYSVHFNYYNQGFNNITMTIILMHGTVSSIATILIHQPYREALFQLLGVKKKVNVQPEISAIVSNITVT